MSDAWEIRLKHVLGHETEEESVEFEQPTFRKELEATPPGIGRNPFRGSARNPSKLKGTRRIGDSYFNTVDDVMYVWDGDVWIPVGGAPQKSKVEERPSFVGPGNGPQPKTQFVRNTNWEAFIKVPLKKRVSYTPTYQFYGNAGRLQFEVPIKYGSQYVPGSLELVVTGSLANGASATFVLKEENGRLLTSYPEKGTEAGTLQFSLNGSSVDIVSVDFYIGVLPLVSLLELTTRYDCEETSIGSRAL